MNKPLAQYLKDNKEQILETWLTSAIVPSVPRCNSHTEQTGAIPVSYLSEVIDQVIYNLQHGQFSINEGKQNSLNTFLGHTCACRNNRLVCDEVRESGCKSFSSIFEEDWDIDFEFNEFDRDYAKFRIDEILQDFFSLEIDRCSQEQRNHKCPYKVKALAI
jgi:hypothetical protein